MRCLNSFVRSLAPLLLLLLSSMCTSVEGMDFLCGSISKLPPSDRYDCLISSDPPLTCGKLYLDLLGGSNSYLASMKNQYRNMCCNSGVAKKCLANPGAGGGGSSQGTQPTCHICASNPNRVITNNSVRFSIRYLAPNMSCNSLQQTGRNGFIPSWMCAPLAAQMDSICACKNSNGYTPPQTPTTPTRGPHANCYICGGDPNAHPTNSQVRMSIPGLSNSASCNDVKSLGLSGNIDGGMCAAIAPQLYGICGCSRSSNQSAAQQSVAAAPQKAQPASNQGAQQNCEQRTNKDWCKQAKNEGCKWNKNAGTCFLK